MGDPFLFREKELLKLNTEINNKTKLLINNLPQQPLTIINETNKIKKFSPKMVKRNKNLLKLVKNEMTTDNNKLIEKTGDVTSTFFNQKYIDGSATDLYNKITSITKKSVDLCVNNVTTDELDSVNNSTRSIKNGNTPSTLIVSDKIAKRNITTDGLIRYLKAKVILLQEELELAQKDNIKKSHDITVSLELQRKVEQHNESLQQKNQQLNQQLTKLEETNKQNETQLKEHEIELKMVSRELEKLKRYIRSLTQMKISLERRFLKIQDDLQTAHCKLTNANDIEKENREKTRQEHDMYEKQIKQLRHHRYDLLQAYKKQLLLLDNLKRQVTCVEQSKLIDFGEKEFTKILDWNKK